MKEKVSFIFIIDTEQYAGSFEREMCAYATGRIGECNKGTKEAAQFQKDLGLVESYQEDYPHLFSFIISKPDESGCHRPCAVWETKGWFNNGLGGHYRNGDNEEAQKDYMDRCLKESSIRKYQDDVAQDTYEEGWKERAKIGCGIYPAYMSVAIFMEREPNGNELGILTRRTKEYAKNNNITITGFRILQEKTIFKTLRKLKTYKERSSFYE
jgi:hypothetical protein